MGKRKVLGRRLSGLGLGLGMVLGMVPGTGSAAYAAAVAPEAYVVVGGNSMEVSLETALEVVENEGTIELLRNVTIPQDKTYKVNEEADSFTLNLNGNTLAVEGTLTSENENAWMIVDSGFPGIFTSSGTIDVSVQGFSGDEYTFTDGIVNGYFTLDGGTMAISGGEFAGGLMVENGGSANVDFTVSGAARIRDMELYATEGDYEIAITLAGGYYNSNPSVVDDNTAEFVKINGTLQQYSSTMTDWAADSDTYGWRIRPLSIEDAEITIAKQTYTGMALEPVPTVVLNGVTLKKGDDFTVTYKNNINAGEGTAVIEGAGSVSGKVETPFVIDPKDVNNCDAWTVPNYSKYTGEPVTPAVKLWDFDTYTQPVEGTDYVVTGYSDNKNVGTATATIEGRGNFTGTKDVGFHIIDMSRYAYAKPKLDFVTVGNVAVDSEGKVMSGKTLLTVGFEIDSRIKEMEFYATVTNSSGMTAILAGPLTTARPEDESYGGYMWTPSTSENHFTYEFAVPTLGEEDTQEWTTGSDGWSYVNGAKEGDEIQVYATGYFTIAFEGEEKLLWVESEESNAVSFEMTKDSSGKTFEAAAAKTSIKDAQIAAIAGQTHTGKKIEPEVTVTCGDTVLKKGTDFTVSYTNNVNVGIATVTVTGAGDYDGELTGSFVISGWEQKDKKWYYLGLDGKYMTGWKQIGGKWYFFDAKGVMATGWKQLSKKWYYFGKDGIMRTGWQQISGNWYYFKSGVMLTNWQQLSGKWYHFGTDGIMKTGWQQIGKKWYFFKGGVMTTGWLYLGKKWYYFDGSGVMVTGEKKIGGKTYSFNASGVCLNP